MFLLITPINMIINIDLLNQITAEAQKNPRLRMNYNLHDSLEAKAQRLLNALEPGTILPVHRHMNTSETYILLRGQLNVLFYDDNKNLTATFELNSTKGNFGIHIPIGQWHTLEVIETGTTIFEVKDGPYTPLTAENILK